MDETSKDVVLAWKSLQKAKAVLRKIEHKFYHQTWRCAKSQAARRKLWHEESFDGERNKDEMALNEKSKEIPPAYREDSSSAPCSSAGEEDVDAEGTAGTWSSAKSLFRPRRDHFRQQTDSRGNTVQKETSPCSLCHPPQCPARSSPCSAAQCGSWKNILLPTYHLSSGSKLSAGKLEDLWKKSPQNKLEQLKRRIQEQKQKWEAARQKKCLVSAYAKEPLQKRSLKRKVCKVMSAPPAPAHRGQYAVNWGALSLSDEEHGIPGREEFTIPGQGRDYKKAPRIKDKRERSSAWRVQTQSQRQPSPKSPVLERAATGKDVKLPGASAWREGQKLARKLLGPPPTFPNLKNTATTPSKAPTKDTKQILRSLHLQSQCHNEYRYIRLHRDTVKGRGEILQGYLGIHSPSPGPWDTALSAFSGEKICSSAVKGGAKPRTSGNCSRGESASPQRQRGSSSSAQKESEKENLKNPSKRVNIKKPHPYSPEIIQEFMYQKKEERKKKRLEEKKSLVQATELRNKRLQEVYRKQREAVGGKTCSDQMQKLMGKPASAKGSPQGKREREQTTGGIPERSFMAWVDKTSWNLLNEDHRGRNQLKAVQSPKTREASASPATPESKCWFVSPLKREDSRDCSPLASHTPPLTFLPQEDTKPYSKDLTSGLSPYRSKQERVKIIHSLSKELSEKIEMATKRLNAVSWTPDSTGRTSSEKTLELYNKPSSVPEPDTFKDEQDRTMTIQMLLDAPDPDALIVPSGREFQELGRISLGDSTVGATALDRQMEIAAPLPSGLRCLIKGFAVNKSSEVDTSLLHGKPTTGPASPSHRFLSRSPQRELTAQRNHCWGEPKVQDREETANGSPEESLRTRHSRGLQPSSPLSAGAEAQGSCEQDCASVGEGHPGCTELEKKHRSHLDYLRQTSLLLAHKLKVHQLQQRQQLTALREKAKLEVQESQRCLNDLLQHSSGESSSSKDSYPSAPRLDHTEPTQRVHQPEGDNSAGSKQETHSLKPPALKPGRDHSPVDPKIAGERKPLGERDSYPSALQEGSLLAQHREPPHDHQAFNLSSPLVNLHHGETLAGDGSRESSEQGSSASQWSEVGRRYGGSSTFHRFSLAMAEQCLRGEEMRAQHQAALLKLRKRALWEKARAELAWLGHQQRCLEILQDSEGASAMAAKQRRILTEVKQEQAEIQHLQNIYRVAHQERKLILKQQREILMMQHLTAQLQEKLHNLAGKEEAAKSQSLDASLTRSPAAEEEIKLKTVRLISSPKLHSSAAESVAHPEKPDLSGNRDSCVQLKNKQSKKHEGFSTESKGTLVCYQKQAEELPDLEPSFGVQGPDVSEMVAKEVCGASSQTTGSVFMIKDCKNTGLNAQDHVLLPLEHAGSARMGEPVSTPFTREGRKCAFLESVLEEKALISNPKIDPKDNEDINPHDSKFTMKSLGMLSTLCNLCLVQAENTLQGTGKMVEISQSNLQNNMVLKSDGFHFVLFFYLNVPVKEVDVPVPYDTQQVDGRQCLKHLDHISHETPDEELQAFSEGLTCTDSSLRLNNFSPGCQSAKSDSSLLEFQQVSAVRIDISESSSSDSESELKNGEDTDVSIPQEFVCDNDDAFPDVLKELLIARSNGKETLLSDKHTEYGVPEEHSTEAASCSQKYPGDDSDHGCTDQLLSFIALDKVNASAHSSQSDNPAKGRDEPHLDDLENYSRNKACSQDITNQGKAAVASSSHSDDIYSPKTNELQKPSSATSRVKKDAGINSFFVDQNRSLTGFPLTDSSRHLDSVTDQLRNSFPPDRDTENNKLLTCLSSRNLSASGGENNHAQLLNKRLESSKPSQIASLSTFMPGISEEVHTETNSFESLQRVATENQNTSTTEKQAIKEERRGLCSSVSSKKQLLQAENCSSKGEDDTIFISDEGLPPTDEETLSEILSPVDEVLSYGSADLPSSNKKDLSFPSEDLPPPPLGTDATKNDAPILSMDDLPSPPEQMTVLETRQCTDEDVSLKMDTLPPLPDNIVPEDFPLLSRETTAVFSTQDGTISEQYLVKGISGAMESFSENQQGEHETPMQYSEFLPVPNATASGQAKESLNFTMKQCNTQLVLPKVEDDSTDPLSSFEIGDRVLVKQTQPGTLMFKGQTYFDSGYWAGVALDKAEGDNTGTYKGVKYFECARHCGVFVRPDEISHLSGAKENDSSYTGDEDSDSSDDDESFKGDCKYSEGDEQTAGFTEEKAEDTNSVGGSEVKETQARLHTALLPGKRQKFSRCDQCNEFLCQNNLTCLGSDTEKPEPTEIKQKTLVNVILMESKSGNTEEGNTSKNICSLVEDQKRNKLAGDIASACGKKLLPNILIAFSEPAQHKYKSAFEKDLRQEDSQKLFLFKENSVSFLSEPSATVSDALLHDSDMRRVHGCHTVAIRIATKFVDDAVKEYKKIKRKHGSKADKVFPSSPEASPTTLPVSTVRRFLSKVLDLKPFATRQLTNLTCSSHQHMLVTHTQKQYFYKLDQWHSAPWMESVEVPLVIPHCSSYVKELSACAAEELWTPQNIYSEFRRISVPKYFKHNDLPGNDLETESKRMHNQVTFDLTRELLCAEYQVTANPNAFLWMRDSSRRLCRRTDVSDVKIQELCKEESQWTYYDDDELTMKMRMTGDIFDSLILDTVRVLKEIYLRKACDSKISLKDF
ncbi:LOW QUALITY PROTEIN: coiled-coil domain-containing protein 187 [Amazona ochrocephala]